MAKRQVRPCGRLDPRANIYSEDHRRWGEDLRLLDIDSIEGLWVEWAKHEGAWFPVALIEEHSADTVVDRRWQLARYLDLSKIISAGTGRTVHAFEVSWTVDEARPIGQRIQWVEVTCLNTKVRRSWSREQWIDYLWRLRAQLREQLAWVNTGQPVQYRLLDFFPPR